MCGSPVNPWLNIPAGDYVGHMSHPAVGQRAVLNRLLRDALADVRPQNLLVTGCSTGNGLEHVNPAVTERVTVVDINPSYLQQLANQFSNAGFSLEIRCVDVSEAVFEPNGVDLMHAALVLEYVDWKPLLPRLASALTPGGVLSVVLQRPSSASPAVTPTQFASLRLLESQFHFVDAESLIEAAATLGLTVRLRRTEPLPSGKAFEVLRFVRLP